MTDLLELARPFPAKFVHANPSGGGTYVSHDVVVQRLLQVVGPYSYEIVQIVRGHVPEIPPNPKGTSQRAKQGRPALTDAVVGVVARLTVQVDGRTVSIDEAGDCEDPHNWPHDGARMKDASSDAIKRCCMRLGLGLHLWAQDEYFLDTQLQSDAGTSDTVVTSPTPQPPATPPTDATSTATGSTSTAPPPSVPAEAPFDPITPQQLAHLKWGFDRLPEDVRKNFAAHVLTKYGVDSAAGLTTRDAAEVIESLDSLLATLPPAEAGDAA